MISRLEYMVAMLANSVDRAIKEQELVNTNTEIAKHLAEVFKEEAYKAPLWLLTPNPLFGGLSPADLIVVGRGHKVLNFIRAAKEGDI